MMCACIAKERGIRRGSVHNSSPTQVLERSRKLSKDEMILRLGDGKAVTVEAVGSLRLSNLIMAAQDKRKVDNHENALDMGKMTKKPFVGQSAVANGLLYLVYTDVCGSLTIPVRGGFSYFITFTDDHSRYDYVYLMRYKSEAFGRFKEYRLEVENQTNRKIKAIRSDRGVTPVGMPQLNRVAERRNRTLLDMVRSMMSFTELPSSFWGYALETAAKFLNIAPSKSVPQTPYEIWYGKPASYKYLKVWSIPAYVKRLVGDKQDSRSSFCRFIGYPKETMGYYNPAEQKIFVSRNVVFLKKGFLSDSRRDEVLIEESSEELQHDSTTSFEPTVHTDGVPVFHRLTRESRIPERYGFVGLTSQLDNDTKTYEETMSDINLDKWLETMKSKMDSMGSNQARSERIHSTTWVDFEETYSPVAMAKSIRILLAIAPEGFTVVGEEQKVCLLQRSIYGLKQASRSWNTRFDEVIRGYDFIKNDYDPCIYKKISGSSVAYLVLYVDDILLIGNDVKMLGDIKVWLSTQFSMKDMGEASYIIGIKIYRDRSRRMLG
ncbi:UNVERIFIED_CONTAM: Retrovirus-related Pol polyprotein from transposon RE1 [Sesamum radiatum]|uniref:Retrovirus-related Pol polyprotein from transposon RE1 n=1 Tax=Sesamum radiatum TaxID=300843 RepID=A0AAW2PHK6_SESRA